MTSRNNILDIFKGIAIVAVILYHAGLLTYGYLGVEIFLVIGGYLITKSIMHLYYKDKFSFLDYLCKRLVRLWPLALLITIVSLAGGYFFMLPDAFKNTCETAVGTCFFVNNFIQYITAGNYWDTANDYKPLMHTWYLGVIFQFYVLYPLLFMFCHRFSNDFLKALRVALVGVFVFSLSFYIIPDIDTAVTFYLLPARLFEFAAGGLLAFPSASKGKERDNRIMGFFLLFVIVLICINDAYTMAKVRLLLTVALSALIVKYSERASSDAFSSVWLKALSLFVPLGMASYSLYLWHQVILAFYRYVVNNEFTVWSYIVTLSISLFVGYLSYSLLEKSVTAYTKQSKGRTYLVLSLCLLATILISVLSLKWYKTQGAIRDIPELEVSLNDPSSWEPQEYNARITDLYEKPFPPRNGKKNVLVVGDSYARDWINVLLEGGAKDINLSYSMDIAPDLRKKIEQADIIFVANNASIDRYVDYLPAMMQKKFYRVGHKAFGRGVGYAYNQARMSNDYSQFVVPVYDDINEDERIEFQGMYINLMDSIRNSGGSINLFTADKRLITHDGIHLTRAGAKEFAKRLNINELINRN